MSRRFTTFGQMVCLLFMIVVPALVGCLMLGDSSTDALTSEAAREAFVRLGNAMESIENDLERVSTRSIELLNSDDATRMALLFHVFTAYEKGRIVQNLRQNMQSIEDGSDVVGNVRLLVQSPNWIVNMAGYKDGSYAEDTENLFSRLDGMTENASLRVVWTLPESRVIATTRALKGKALIDAAIDVRAALSILKDANAYDDMRYLMILSGGETVSDMEDARREEIIGAIHPEETREYWLTGRDEICFSVYSEKFDMRFVQVVNNSVVQRYGNTIQLYLMSTILLLVAAVFAYVWIVHKIIRKPITEMQACFANLQSGDFDTRLSVAPSKDFAALYKRFNAMSHSLKTLVQQTYQQELLLQKSEMKQLQAQINPHFLYNSFLLLYTMIDDTQSALAKQTAKKLGQYFQYITRSGRDVVPLSEEWRHARIYADIQRLRFEERVQIDFPELPAELESYPVPRLILQPLLENAFRYGLESRADGGWLGVSAASENGCLMIRVEDNGEDLDEDTIDMLNREISHNSSAPGEITALYNIRKRLSIFTGGKGRLLFERSGRGGLKVTVKL